MYFFQKCFVQRCAMYLPLFWNCCLKGKFKIYLYSHVLQLSRCAAVLHRSQSLINTMKISAVYNTENKIMRIIWDILAVMMMIMTMLRGWFFWSSKGHGIVARTKVIIFNQSDPCIYYMLVCNSICRERFVLQFWFFMPLVILYVFKLFMMMMMMAMIVIVLAM